MIIIEIRLLIFITKFSATLSDWSPWYPELCPVSCATGTQSRKRSCIFDNKNDTALSDDEGCKDGKDNGYYQEQPCNTQPCRELFHKHAQQHFNIFSLLEYGSTEYM